MQIKSLVLASSLLISLGSTAVLAVPPSLDVEVNLTPAQVQSLQQEIDRIAGVKADDAPALEPTIPGATPTDYECRLMSGVDSSNDLIASLGKSAWQVASQDKSGINNKLRVVIRRSDTSQQDKCVRCKASGSIEAYLTTSSGNMLGNLIFKDTGNVEVATQVAQKGMLSCRSVIR